VLPLYRFALLKTAKSRRWSLGSVAVGREAPMAALIDSVVGTSRIELGWKVESAL